MTDDDLLNLARRHTGRSHAPYSGFETAAVVVTGDGDVEIGVLVENVSLGLSMCAERAAMFRAVANGQRPSRLALAAPPTRGGVTWPCGACLQVALELGGPELPVIVGDADGGPPFWSTVADLLPKGPKAA